MKDLHIKDLDNNISFESLLGKLSSKLVNLPLESIDLADFNRFNSVFVFLAQR